MDVKNVDLFFSDNPNPMWIYDPSDRSIQEVNHSALRLYGYSYDEMCSMTIEELRPAGEVEKLKDHLRKNNKKGFDDAGVWHHQKKNGETLFVRVLTTPVSYESNDYKLVVVQDVTSRINYQQKYEMLFEHSLDGVMLTNPNGDILQANKAACKILGMTEEEIISGGREEIVAKDRKLDKALKERSETGEFSGELTYIHKSGRRIPVEVSSSVFTTSTGGKRTSLIFRDISDRKETERALQHEKKFIDIALNSMPGVFFVLNSQGETIRWNNHSTEVFGLTPDEIKGRSAEEFVHEDDKELIRQEIAKVLEGGRSRVELQLYTAGDNTAFYDFIANRFRQDGETYIVGSGVDVSAQKELEKRLNASLKKESKQRKQAEGDRDKLRKMFERAPSVKCVLEGEDLRFVIANQSYRELVGGKEIIGKRIIDVIPEIEEQGIIDTLKEVYHSGDPYLSKELPINIRQDKSGELQEHVFNLIYSPLFNEKGEVYGIFVEGIDISDQLKYQRELEASLREKETLLQEVHHRVKNNLAIVSSMMELQALESKDSVLKDSLRVGQQRIQAIASIHELLYQSDTLSHLNFGETTKKIVEKLRDIYGNRGNILLRMQIEPVNLNVNQAIPCGLIINELLTNAYKHAFKESENGIIEVHLSEEQGNLNISVKDDGMGIPKEFDFKSASTIGMTLVNLLKQQLDADLDIINEEGTHCSLTFEKSEVKGIGSSMIE